MSDYVGIDIGAKSVVMCVRSDGRTAKAQEFSQTPEGHQAQIKKLGQQVAGVVLEATGIYYLDLAVALSRAGLPVSVINPRSFHHFASIKLNNCKTDAVDAALLAEYAECMRPAPWQAPDETLMGLRDLGRQINRLTHARTQAKNRLHALKSKASTLAMLIEDEDQPQIKLVIQKQDFLSPPQGCPMVANWLWFPDVIAVIRPASAGAQNDADQPQAEPAAKTE